MSTTKAQVQRTVLEVDVLCELAAQQVRSYMPTGLGKFWEDEANDLDEMLADIPARFKAAIRKAQRKHGWAAK